MSPSYDCMSSVLLCAEDTSSILDFDEEEEGIQGKRLGWVTQKRNDFYGDSLMVFPLQSDECLARMVEKETEHLPRGDYAERLRSGALDLSIRSESIDWIWKVHAHYNFGPLSAYLSVNYLDRFLSTYELPQGKAWMTQLLLVACLSLAAKMEETEVPLLLDLQVGESKYVFEARTIQRMEVLVLSTLKWRMQAVTPFSFIDYFLHKFNDGNSPTKLMISRSMELILNTVRGTDYLAFRPSDIAAAVALSALGETQIVDVEKGASCCTHIAKERLLRCYEVIQDNILMRNRLLKNARPMVSSAPQSPIAVLDTACLSYKSDDITVGSNVTCHHTSPVSKRRKISTSSIP